ncbi:hypothetical protein GUJ93_ZPchr0013g37365 [Zizania palustris]|uniref:Uncharacterized protein n=1 Tax=Zizania palustris TaxID=103762 RepID=A0A8J5WYP0_ZIZPA|nr:hypothetical protein GUJ93_ZPchr0013g37365 [Zizania palustris]
MKPEATPRYTGKRSPARERGISGPPANPTEAAQSPPKDKEKSAAPCVVRSSRRSRSRRRKPGQAGRMIGGTSRERSWRLGLDLC